MNRPLESEYAPSFQGYVAQVSEEEILPVLRSQLDHLDVLFGRVTPERETFAYAEGKWSIRELAGHLIDGERVFGYRAFCIARGETRNLPGFDEKEYMLSAPYNQIDLEDLLSELRLVRLANIAMLRNLDEQAPGFRARARLHYGRPRTSSHGSSARTLWVGLSDPKDI